MFNKGEEEYDYLLIDLQQLNLGVQNMEVDHSVTFSPGEELAEHQALDDLLSQENPPPPPVPKTPPVPRSRTLDWDDLHDLEDWSCKEEEEHSKKRKNSKSHRSTRQVRVVSSRDIYYCKHAQYLPKHRGHSQQQHIQLCCAPQLQHDSGDTQTGSDSHKNLSQSKGSPTKTTRDNKEKVNIDHQKMALLGSNREAALMIESDSITRAGTETEKGILQDSFRTDTVTSACSQSNRAGLDLNNQCISSAQDKVLFTNIQQRVPKTTQNEWFSWRGSKK